MKFIVRSGIKLCNFMYEIYIETEKLGQEHFPHLQSTGMNTACPGW